MRRLVFADAAEGAVGGYAMRLAYHRYAIGAFDYFGYYGIYLGRRRGERHA